MKEGTPENPSSVISTAKPETSPISFHLHLKTVIQALCDEDETDTSSTHSLTLFEWKLMQGAVTIIKPFLVATKAWEAEKTPTMNLMIRSTQLQ